MSAKPPLPPRTGKVPSDLMAIAAYGELRSLTRQYLWRRVRAQTLPAYRVGHLLYVSLAEADEALFKPTMPGQSGGAV